METTKEIIVAFSIGRGGRFNNAGYLSFLGEEKIGKYTDELSMYYENERDFMDRYGYDSTTDEKQHSIVELITNEDFDELELKFGITKAMLGDKKYYTSAGYDVGLTEKEKQSGIGKINIDGYYDTTYTRYLSDCSKEEIEAIESSNNYKSQDLIKVLTTFSQSK